LSEGEETISSREIHPVAPLGTVTNGGLTIQKIQPEISGQKLSGKRSGKEGDGGVWRLGETC